MPIAAWCHRARKATLASPRSTRSLYEPTLTTERMGLLLLRRRRSHLSPARKLVQGERLRALFADGSDCYRNYECAPQQCLLPPSGAGIPTGTCAARTNVNALRDGTTCTDEKSVRACIARTADANQLRSTPDITHSAGGSRHRDRCRARGRAGRKASGPVILAVASLSDPTSLGFWPLNSLPPQMARSREGSREPSN